MSMSSSGLSRGAGVSVRARWRGGGGLVPAPPAGLLGHPLAAASPLQLAASNGGPVGGHQTYPPGFLLHVLAMLSSSNLHPELAVQARRPPLDPIPPPTSSPPTSAPPLRKKL